MSDIKHRVAIIGCGRMGQNYAEAYTTYPDTEIVAIADANVQRRDVLGARFDVSALYPDVEALLRDIVPDIAVVVTPTKYMKDVVIACAEAGVKGISTEKPIAACLQDADAMVKVCAERGVVFAGGNLQRAMNEVQEAASRLHNGRIWGKSEARVFMDSVAKSLVADVSTSPYSVCSPMLRLRKSSHGEPLLKR